MCTAIFLKKFMNIEGSYLNGRNSGSCLFYVIGNSVGIPYYTKKPYRAGSHCGGKVDVARSDPPQAENPASRILFYDYSEGSIPRGALCERSSQSPFSAIATKLFMSGIEMFA